MSRLFSRSTYIVLGVIFLLAFNARGGEAKYVFLFIGDGLSVNLRHAFTAAHPQSNLSKFELAALTNTLNANDEITDSAAAATALATGVKTVNGVLGLDRDGKPLSGLAEKFHARGYGVGLITNDGINGATPAAFYAKRPQRTEYLNIIHDLANCKFTFLAGGGVYYDNELDAEKFRTIMDAAGQIVRLADTLVNFTTAALAILSSNPRGFFLMVEGGVIDHVAHNNDLAAAINEIREFDLAIGVALAFYEKFPAETLIIVTSDHDTGGLYFTADKPLTENAAWTTTKHTAMPVITNAHGCGAPAFAAITDNTQIAPLIEKAAWGTADAE